MMHSRYGLRNMRYGQKKQYFFSLLGVDNSDEHFVQEALELEEVNAREICANPIENENEAAEKRTASEDGEEVKGFD